ncbi:MAG TPA: hypothetical protein VKE42_02325 [Candidatus Cybelea sp.]|nr:hypothetical protein [Candidatus Cybelea sp.]
MLSYSKRAALALIGVLTAAGCGGNAAVPPAQSGVPNGVSQEADSAVTLVDHTSILKKLTKDVVIGSTVDPGNGDTGPHAISVVQTNYGLKKGQVVTCNYANSGGTEGKGTTIDVLNPQPGSNPTTLVQSSKILGCTGAATTLGNEVWAAGNASILVAGFDHTGSLLTTYGSPFKAPFSVADAHCKPGPACLYASEMIFGSDAKTGGIVDFSVNNYGNPNATEVATGFAVNGKSGWSALGPSGLSYNENKLGTLYITDGVNNTVVAFTNASNLLAKDEITVLKGGKTFKCKYHGRGDPCGKLIYSGSPLNAPVAMTMLPNGNLVVANSAGGNKLIEIDVSTGKVLATKVVDKSKTQGVFALHAIGTKDTNTALYYTDTNDNNLHELEQ